jgi:hypothetical protein
MLWVIGLPPCGLSLTISVLSLSSFVCKAANVNLWCCSNFAMKSGLLNHLITSRSTPPVANRIFNIRKVGVASFLALRGQGIGGKVNGWKWVAASGKLDKKTSLLEVHFPHLRNGPEYFRVVACNSAGTAYSGPVEEHTSWAGINDAPLPHGVSFGGPGSSEHLPIGTK